MSKEMVKISQEHPRLSGFRLYARHREAVDMISEKLTSRKDIVSKSEAVRRAIALMYEHVFKKPLV